MQLYHAKERIFNLDKSAIQRTDISYFTSMTSVIFMSALSCIDD